ncbi:NADH:flavin oxidoreductase [Chengkuizengella sp. SCS-71B]|uniref:NADH:flavin oxidoreductase n=1 Tax=Chengkuizengella sp. SCS-71B TaxID=3115290 RepID=UPI0032C22A95
MSVLFNSPSIGKLQMKNRFTVAPLTRTSATHEGVVTEKNAKYYARFAKGQFGLIITEGTYTDDQHSQGYFNQPGIINQEQIDGWKKVVDAVHKEGSKIIVQLMHAGAQAVGNRFTEQSIAPSSVLLEGEMAWKKTPKAASIEDLIKIKNNFVKAALNAKEAGFDGVELHGANGYLLDEFLLTYTNKRQDQYGGSVQNRVRYLVEIIQAVREAVGEDFIVGIRLTQNNHIDGYTHKWEEGDAEVIFSSVKDAGVDYIHTFQYEGWKPAFGENSKSLATAAKKYGQVTVIANGNLHELNKASEMVQDKDADFIAIGKLALSNPDLPVKAKNGVQFTPFDAEKFIGSDYTIKEFEYHM